jgi:hypothetical protein
MIAFQVIGFQAGYEKSCEIICMENPRGQTTNKHLNLIQNDRTKRVSEEEFYRLFNEAMQVFAADHVGEDE